MTKAHDFECSTNPVYGKDGAVCDCSLLQTDADLEILRGMWASCADDLRRWAEAFRDPTGMTVDATTSKALEQLATALEKKATDVK